MVPTCSAGWVVVVLSYGTTTYPRVGGVRMHMLCMYIHRVLRTPPVRTAQNLVVRTYEHYAQNLVVRTCAHMHNT